MKNRCFKISRFVNFYDDDINNIVIAYVFYQFLIFKSTSLNMLNIVRNSALQGIDIPQNVPDSFIDYLVSKRIIVENGDPNGV